MSNPLRSFITANGYLLRGRLRFPADRVGSRITASDGSTFTIFREISIDNGPERFDDSSAECSAPKSSGAKPSRAVFEVWFTLKSMSAGANRVFSWLPVPFFIGLPGFRAKLWATDDESGACYGCYRWATVAAAERYAASYAMAFMKRRSIPGSVSHRITRLQDFESDEIGTGDS